MATLTDIARALGVSKSTVSKALNGAADVSASMRASVLEKAVELGYSLPTRRSTVRWHCLSPICAAKPPTISVLTSCPASG